MLVAAAVALEACARTADEMQTARHDLVSIRVPRTWRMAATAEGGTICEDPASSAVLRVDVVTADTDAEVTAASALRIATDGREVVTLTNGNALHADESTGTEQGKAIHTCHWQLAHVPRPGQLYIAFFSLTVTREEAKTEATKKLAASLRREIEQAVFPSVRETGTTSRPR
jgi:hypothetical protein